jgi:hypothetical protein
VRDDDLERIDQGTLPDIAAMAAIALSVVAGILIGVLL